MGSSFPKVRSQALCRSSFYFRLVPFGANFVTAQLMLGHPALWMARFICERSISRDLFNLLTTKLSPILQRAERILRPRITLLLHSVHVRIVGAACLLLTIVLFLPIPFGNIPLAFALAAFALGIPEHDGLATLSRWLATVGSLLILAAVSSAIIAGVSTLLDQLWVLIGRGLPT